MAKSASKIRRSARSNTNNNNPKSTASQPTLQPIKNQTDSITTPSKKENNVPPVSPTPNKHDSKFPDAALPFGLISNDENQHVLRAPLPVALTEFFLTLHKSHRHSIQAYTFIDRSADSREDDKEIELRIQRGLTLMDLEDEPDMAEWHRLFKESFTSTDSRVQSTSIGAEIRELGLNLAASDPLELFDSTEFDGEGNLFPSSLAYAWLGAT
jgi:hypothetical protein